MQKYLFTLLFLLVAGCAATSPPVEFVPRVTTCPSQPVVGITPELKPADTTLRANRIVSSGNQKLTDKELELAKVAWKYFENNYQETTGLANAVNDYPSTTMWDTASYLGGLVAVYELGIIQQPEFDKRLTKLLETLNKVEFFRNELPNKAYNTKTAEKSHYNNTPGEIGFSSLDLGRLLVWLKIIKESYPKYTDSIDKFVLRWDFSHVLDKSGLMYGAKIDNKGQDVAEKCKKDNKCITAAEAKLPTLYVQEGRLGYEEYSAKGFQLWGFNTQQASQFDPYNFVSIFDIEIPYDIRDPRVLIQHNYVVTESYVLDAIELNWDLPQDTSTPDTVHSDSKMAGFAQQIYAVQEARYRNTGIPTARTEHQLDGKPYFVYDTIYTDGFAWNTISDKGEHLPQFAAVALKGALGLWAVWDTPYTQLLFDRFSSAHDPEKGFYEGVYESGKDNPDAKGKKIREEDVGKGYVKEFTANNNGIILETLLYKTKGKLLKFGEKRETPWDKALQAGHAKAQAYCPK